MAKDCWAAATAEVLGDRPGLAGDTPELADDKPEPVRDKSEPVWAAEAETDGTVRSEAVPSRKSTAELKPREGLGLCA
jgi:hypothetical protein